MTDEMSTAPRAHGWGGLLVIRPDGNHDLKGSDQKAGKKSEKTDEETKERYNEASQFNGVDKKHEGRPPGRR
jgi:hypothetical protein